MKKLYSPLILLILSILLSSCASTTKDIEIETASDPKVNLKAYTTYAWLGSAEVLNDPEGKWQPPKFDVSSDIKFLIDSELRAKGLTEVADQDAEVAISFFTGVDMEAQQLKADPAKDVEIPENVPKAALIVVALDVNTGYVIWMGLATGDVKEGATVKQSKARIAYAINKMFNPRFYDSWFK
ncbi:hypothetical protein AU255_05485 [Methyloprofundus sedimenti]|uniref:DUF4136 domain-containing protein n=1 Tax=Methyloprofundus sedimenti TaxID=1420851 RepID=A0A1V8M712_9GAMM|nr:DUF4136 domain-containing protein [Methyloprofundus sedimenti]OQK17335.1 hypothetical protein AU255_05485 [Methyloprofundus sedimenti]